MCTFEPCQAAAGRALPFRSPPAAMGPSDYLPTFRCPTYLRSGALPMPCRRPAYAPPMPCLCPAYALPLPCLCPAAYAPPMPRLCPADAAARLLHKVQQLLPRVSWHALQLRYRHQLLQVQGGWRRRRRRGLRGGHRCCFAGPAQAGRCRYSVCMLEGELCNKRTHGARVSVSHNQPVSNSGARYARMLPSSRMLAMDGPLFQPPRYLPILISYSNTYICTYLHILKHTT